MKTFTAVSGTVAASRKLCLNILGKHGVRRYVVNNSNINKIRLDGKVSRATTNRVLKYYRDAIHRSPTSLMTCRAATHL